MTPVDFAIRQDKLKTADLLRKHGGKTGEELNAEWASLHIPFRFKVVQWGNLKVFKQFSESELLNLSKN